MPVRVVCGGSTQRNRPSVAYAQHAMLSWLCLMGHAGSGLLICRARAPTATHWHRGEHLLLVHLLREHMNALCVGLSAPGSRWRGSGPCT